MLRLPFAFFAFIILTLSCKKSGNSPKSYIKSLFPTAARAGDTITLEMDGSDLNKESVSVSINNQILKITGISDHEIKCVVQQRYDDGFIYLKLNNQVIDSIDIEYRSIPLVTTIAGQAGINGLIDGTGAEAAFNCTLGIALDQNNNLLVADSKNHALRRINLSSSTYEVSTIPIYNQDFKLPQSIAVDRSNGNIFITDLHTHVMKFDTQLKDTMIYTSPINYGTSGIAVGPDGKVYVAENLSNRVFTMNQNGTELSTISTQVFMPRKLEFDQSGKLFTSSTHMMEVLPSGKVVNYPQEQLYDGWEFTINKAGHFYLADHFKNRILKVNRYTGKVSIIAGNGRDTDVDGIGTDASINAPNSIILDDEGNMYVSSFNFGSQSPSRIRKITFE